jgi:hypothetical protein
MDPNENLKQQLAIARAILADKSDHSFGAVQLAELVEALDGWITKGGFLPDRWRKDPRHCSLCGHSIVGAGHALRGLPIGDCCWDDPMTKALRERER